MCGHTYVHFARTTILHMCMYGHIQIRTSVWSYKLLRTGCMSWIADALDFIISTSKTWDIKNRSENGVKRGGEEGRGGGEGRR